MQIINLRKASFVPRFHKHWLHFFYSFSKIMLLLKDNEHIRNGHVKVSTYQKGPQERKCSSGHHRLPWHSLFLSCQTEEEVEAETYNPNNTNSDSLQLVQLGHYADRRSISFLSDLQVPNSHLPETHSAVWYLCPSTHFEGGGAFKTELFYQVSWGTLKSWA